jgi:hypothetical protein
MPNASPFSSFVSTLDEKVDFAVQPVDGKRPAPVYAVRAGDRPVVPKAVDRHRLSGRSAKRPISGRSRSPTIIPKAATRSDCGGFGNWFRDQCDAAGLHHCSAHGRERRQCRRKAEAGFTQQEIKAWSGNKGDAEVALYVRGAGQAGLAEGAVPKLSCR